MLQNRLKEHRFFISDKRSDAILSVCQSIKSVVSWMGDGREGGAQQPPVITGLWKDG